MVEVGHVGHVRGRRDLGQRAGPDRGVQPPGQAGSSPAGVSRELCPQPRRSNSTTVGQLGGAQG
jgi:hypothetical protein